jgi:cysteine synthase
LAKDLPGRVEVDSFVSAIGTSVTITGVGGVLEQKRSGIRIIAGVSSGVAVHAALAIAERQDAGRKIIMVIPADTRERYITTSLFFAGAEQPQR